MTDEETNINLLFGLALDRIAFLPFSYMIDKFRWDVYSGLASKEDMNCHWFVLVPIIITVLTPRWKLRHSIQGLQPPTTRSKEQFDAGAKYHVAAGIGYVRYFTALIYKFQFFRSMCLESGSYVPGDPSKPLHR